MLTELTINQTRIDLQQGDITQQTTDAIVNAANSALAGGGGVDGAIHRAAGATELLAATRAIGRCPTGEAVITPGFKLKARYIIHAVGPVYRADNPESPRLLASAYRRSLEVAAAQGDISSIAFPAISTGVYGYPMAAAALIAITTLADYAAQNLNFSLMRLVLFNTSAFEAFAGALAEYAASLNP